MKFTKKDIYEKILAPQGFLIGTRFHFAGSPNTYTITKNYTYETDAGIELGTVLDMCDAPIERKLLDAEEMRAMLPMVGSLANGYLKEWLADESRDALYYLYWDAYDDCVCVNVTDFALMAGTPYFESEEQADKAIASFTSDQWKVFFGLKGADD